jgi:hypothetical protein
LPYNSFLELIEEAKENNWFPYWEGKDCDEHRSSPLELLVLGAVQHVGCGFLFDDL